MMSSLLAETLRVYVSYESSVSASLGDRYLHNNMIATAINIINT
jgi:preprotein translocase subunit SecD